ncbi:DNA-binding transcriptional regulator, GntR family [Roseovarius tolerans]|uniref:DNA-binding transcriptional regulator, GntR family n=1 Tax=Roseovarius tolerans TaxID=74031 RepID=A0A1H7WWJ8_9RHOB|nr:DNA-binding transcriptional regulator, GntR family [Roseovarius tolerans]
MRDLKKDFQGLQDTRAASTTTSSRSDKGDGLTDQAHQALLARLRNGGLASGSFLSMPMLVEELGLPMAATREAVKRAEASGLLRILPKRGITVMDAGPETTRECLELRAMFDCEGARRIIESGNDFPLATLRAEHERLHDAAATTMTAGLPDVAIRTDLSLHDALARGLDSGLAQRLYAENRDRIAVIQNTRPFLADRIASAMREHLAILDAIEARDTPRAMSEIREHLRHTLRWWGVYLD